jgi:hypothetical protein
MKQRRLTSITLLRTIAKSPTLLPQYWKNVKFDSTKNYFFFKIKSYVPKVSPETAEGTKSRAPYS